MKSLAAATVLLGAVIVLSPTSALGDGGGQRMAFWGGFGAAANCDGSGVIPSPTTVRVPAFGFAILNASSDGKVGATVAIRDIPNGYYTVRVIQGIDDCNTIDWAGFANGNGNLTIHLSEPTVSTFAFVAVDQWATFDGVPVAVNASFVTDTDQR